MHTISAPLFRKRHDLWSRQSSIHVISTTHLTLVWLKTTLPPTKCVKKVHHCGFLSCQSAIMALHYTASMMQCVSATIGNTTPTKHVIPVLPVIVAGLLLPAQLMATSVDCVIGQSMNVYCGAPVDGMGTSMLTLSLILTS